MKLAFFAASAPGIETLLLEEVAARVAGATDIVSIAGGVTFAGDERTLASALFDLGLASRLLVRIARFPVRELRELEGHVARLPWSGWLVRGAPRVVRATARGSRLYHTGAIVERVERAIATRLGDDAPSGEDVPAHERASLAVRLEDDHCTISLDASGEPLHRRGHRLDPSKAPLREDLARALVVASGWDGKSALVDPMCGSGTVLVEAATWALGRAPGLERRFGIEATALARATELERHREELRARPDRAAPLVVGSDRDTRAVSVAAAHAERARVSIDVSVRALSDAVVTAGSTILTNPPWGQRVSEGRDLRALYQTLGTVRRRAGEGGRLALIAKDRALAHQTGVPLRSAFLTDAGGTKVHAWVEAERS